ncbi:MAG: M23 family metallopeptidase [Spirochaetia bacterium]|nr:M23 family metallopeptidase [Spirochaetia bacterium]
MTLIIFSVIITPMEKTLQQMKKEIKTVSFHRLVVLSGVMAFAVALIFASIFLNSSEVTAYAPVKPETFRDIMKDKGQNLDALYKDSYTELSKRDKDLAYIYLRQKLLAKDLGCVLYKVKQGQNFWGIARDFKINIDTIIGANPEFEDLRSFTNQEIVVPNKIGVIHEVRNGEENAAMLADIYKVDRGLIESANKFPIFGLKPGDLLFIPGAKPVYMSESLQQLNSKRRMFRSPLSGRYTSLTGTRIHPVTGEKSVHQGVDIKADMGTWVGAAADGTVTFAGWGGNLGYCVKIIHKDGFMTVYGHLSKINCRNGQKVFAGKLIAKTGNSGRTTGPHLHFALYKNGKLQDPLKYLW